MSITSIATRRWVAGMPKNSPRCVDEVRRHELGEGSVIAAFDHLLIEAQYRGLVCCYAPKRIGCSLLCGVAARPCVLVALRAPARLFGTTCLTPQRRTRPQSGPRAAEGPTALAGASLSELAVCECALRTSAGEGPPGQAPCVRTHDEQTLTGRHALTQSLPVSAGLVGRHPAGDGARRALTGARGGTTREFRSTAGTCALVPRCGGLCTDVRKNYC